MASFYDCVNNTELMRIEGLLKQGGIVYTLREIDTASTLKEIQVAEEDLADAERILCSSSHENH